MSVGVWYQTAPRPLPRLAPRLRLEYGTRSGARVVGVSFTGFGKIADFG